MANCTVRARPAKPRKDFPLFPHASGRWAKKVRGKFAYFGKTVDDPKGKRAIIIWLDQKEDLLAGHNLTVGGGGVFHGTFRNGVIRPGQHAGGELIVHDATISANLVDNGTPTSVIYAGRTNITGTNSYTGKTYVVGIEEGNVHFEGASAIPAGGDIELSGIGAPASLDSGQQHHFGTIAIRDEATFHA